MHRRLAALAMIIFLLGCLAAPAAARQPAVRRMALTVRALPTEACFEVEAVLDTDGRGPAEFLLGKGFTGARFEDVRVRDGKGKEPEHSFRDGILRVGPRQSNGLVVGYRILCQPVKGDPYSALAVQAGPEDCHVNATVTRTDTWFPRPADWQSRRLPPFTLAVDVPADLEVMASGTLAGIADRPGRRLFSWRSYVGMTDRSLYFFARRCARRTFVFPDGFRVHLYLPQAAREENVRFLTGIIHRSYRFFEETFGSTGLGEYKAMAVPYRYSGLFNSMTFPEELATRKIVNNDILFPTRNVLHEVSHTWWGNLVTARLPEDYWLFEGFAKYSEIIALGPVLRAKKETEAESFRRLKLVYGMYLGRDGPVRGGGFESRDLQVAVVYYKGALILRNLAILMGEKDFRGALRDYVAAFRGKVADTEDFARVMERRGGAGARRFVEENAAGAGAARYAVAEKTLGKGSGAVTTVRIAAAGHRDLHTALRIATPQGALRRRVDLPPSGHLAVTVRGPAVTAEVDPDGDSLAFERGIRGPGGFVFDSPRGVTRFTGVLESGPLGRAGIRSGMVLLEVDGVPVKGLGLYRENDILLAKAGRVKHLRVAFAAGDVRNVEIRY